MSALPSVGLAKKQKSTEVLNPGEYFETSWGESITVEQGVVEQSITYLQHFDAPAVHGQRKATYVFGNLRSSYRDRPSRTRKSDYSIVVDKRSTPVSDHIGHVPLYKISRSHEDIRPVFDPENEGMRIEQRTAGAVGAAFPTSTQANSVGIGYSGGGNSLDVIWEFGGDPVQKFNSEPDFSVKRFDVEGPVKHGERTEARAVIENEGDGGMFRAMISAKRSEHPWTINKFVDSNSTETISVRIRPMEMMKPSQRSKLQSGDPAQFVLDPALTASKDAVATYQGDKR